MNSLVLVGCLVTVWASLAHSVQDQPEDDDSQSPWFLSSVSSTQDVEPLKLSNLDKILALRSSGLTQPEPLDLQPANKQQKDNKHDKNRKKKSQKHRKGGNNSKSKKGQQEHDESPTPDRMKQKFEQGMQKGAEMGNPDKIKEQFKNGAATMQDQIKNGPGTMQAAGQDMINQGKSTFG